MWPRRLGWLYRLQVRSNRRRGEQSALYLFKETRDVETRNAGSLTSSVSCLHKKVCVQSRLKLAGARGEAGFPLRASQNYVKCLLPREGSPMSIGAKVPPPEVHVRVSRPPSSFVWPNVNWPTVSAESDYAG